MVGRPLSEQNQRGGLGRERDQSGGGGRDWNERREENMRSDCKITAFY